MAGPEELDLESRRDIYAAIRAPPGVHFRRLFEQLEYAQGTLQSHLRRLADVGLVEVSEDGKYTRYDASGEFDEADRAVMNALRRTLPLDHLPTCTQPIA